MATTFGSVGLSCEKKIERRRHMRSAQMAPTLKRPFSKKAKTSLPYALRADDVDVQMHRTNSRVVCAFADRSVALKLNMRRYIMVQRRTTPLTTLSGLVSALT